METNDKVDLDWDAEEKGEKRGGLSDSLRKIVTTGVSSGFISEENLKQYLNELKLPKDLLSQVLKGAQKSKEELVGRAGSEITKLISKIDLVKEFTKLIQDHKISIKADIEFEPKSKSKKDQGDS